MTTITVLAYSPALTVWQVAGDLAGIDVKAAMLRPDDLVLHATGYFRVAAIADGPRFNPRKVELVSLV